MRFDISSVCYIVAIIVGSVSFWIPKFLPWAIVAIATGLLLIGR